MSRVYADSVQPRWDYQDLTLGASGDTIDIAGNIITADVFKDSGGNTLFESNGSGVLSNVNSGFQGALTLLTTNAASGSSSSEFTSKINSTYDVYIFKYININPDTNDLVFNFQASTNGGTDWGVTQTTTFFRTEHNEDGSSSSLAYQTGQDLAQSAGAQPLGYSVGEDADSSLSGELWLFNPSSTTFVKHYYATTQWQFKNSGGTLQACESFVSGYFNTTSAVDAVRFQMTGGAHFTGTLKMYGL